MAAKPAHHIDGAKILQAQVELLVRSASGTHAYAVIAVILVAAVLWQVTAPQLIVGWGGYMLVLIALRYLQVRRFSAREPEPDALKRFRNWFFAGVVGSGIGWGVAGGALFPPTDVLYQSFLAFVLAGTTAASVTAYGALYTAARAFVILALMPIACMYFVQGQHLPVAMGVLIVAYMGYLLRLSAVVRDTQLSTFALRYMNEDLISELKQAKKEAETVNRQLREQMAVRNQTESALLEAKRKAEQGARAKSDFLATMSHEIRTPMNGVLGMTELLMNTELTAKQFRFADTIRRSGEALLATINDILDFSKIEAGKLEIQHTVFDLRQLVDDTVAAFAERAHRRHLELAAIIPPEQHAAFRGDPQRIRQVLTNLIGNALKFTENGEIAVKVTTTEENNDHNRIRIEVRDTGVGIKEEHQRHIFDSFQQADGSTTRKFGGTGLGLTICNRLTRLMNGEIGVDSESGEGSTFWFTIELAKMPADSISGQINQPLDLAGKRVLVVDDNETNQEILQHQLTAWNMKYYGVQTPDRAMKYLKRAASKGKPFDLVILDRQMPGMNGVQLARQIKCDDEIAKVRLIMLSSVNQLEQTGQWYTAGIEAYINKPVRQVELHDAICSTLGDGDDSHAGTHPLQPTPRATPDVNLGAHVLIAEDNPVNQELAKSMLENLGCSVVVVESGREALEAISDSPLDRMQRRYDVVLMDCQMPEMDGFESTRAIRKWERETEVDPPVPIVALTANAMQGDRDKCLEAGMSDYLSKPFTQDQLRGVIKRWLTLEVEINHAGTLSDTAQRSVSTAGCAELDQKALDNIRALDREGGNKILIKIIRMYLANSPKLLEKMQEAAATNNGYLLRSTAHSLKSASANLGATELAELCKKLEQLGLDDAASEAVATVGIVEFEFEAVCNALGLELERKAA